MTTRFNPLKPTVLAKAPAPTPLKKGQIVTPPPVGPAPILKENNEKDSLELHFPHRPGPCVLGLFHSTKELIPEQRWHFHWKCKFWYASRNEVTRKFAEMLIVHSTKGEHESPAAMPATSVETAENSTFPRVMWQKDLAAGDTRLGYEDWLEQKVDGDPRSNFMSVDFTPEDPEPEAVPVARPSVTGYSWRSRSRFNRHLSPQDKDHL